MIESRGFGDRDRIHDSVDIRTGPDELTKRRRLATDDRRRRRLPLTPPMSDPGIPLRVRLHAWLIHPFSKTRWRAVWVRYWESQGISEEQQMRWAAEAQAADTQE